MKSTRWMLAAPVTGAVGRCWKEIQNWLVVAALVIAIPMTVVPLWAQTVNGTVDGSVTDPSGAEIPGAAVTVTSTATGEVRTVTTNAAGFYSVPALPPGPYTVDAKAKGFQESTSNVQLTVGQTLRADFKMEVGSTSQKVEVFSTDSLGLETENHALTSTVNNRTLENIPTFPGSRGQTFYAQTTQVGVQPVEPRGASGSQSNVGQFNEQSNALLIGGQNVFSTSYLQDGVVDMNYFDQTATVQPPVFATQEVKVIRSNANARYDGASVVNVVSKSGSKELHGTLYEQIQNDYFNARGYNAGPLKEDRYNQFGGNVGWKVPFTHNRLFFFFDYQGYRDIAAAFKQAMLPTKEERAGDFSADLQKNAGTKQPATKIYDPLTAQYDPGTQTWVLQQFDYNGEPNVMPPSRISPFATKFLNEIYPYPNFLNTSKGNNYGSVNSRTKFTHDNFLYRLDYNISDKDRIYGAYNTNNPAIFRPEQWDDCACAENNELYGTDIYVEESHVFTNNLVNTARVGYSRSITGKNFNNVGNGIDYFKQFGLTGLNPDSSVWSWPNIFPGGYAHPTSDPDDATQNMYEYSDEVNWVHGTNSMFFGGEFDWILYKGVWDNGDPNGSLSTDGEYTYDGSKSAWKNTGQWLPGNVKIPIANSLADYMLGYYTSTNATAGTAVGWFNQYNIMPYFQDNWHATRKLTLNLGLRYDYYSPPKEKNGHAGIYDIVNNKYTVGTYKPNRMNFSPRVGFAYAVNNGTVVHGGFGIYYYQFGYFDLGNMMNDPFYVTQLNSVQSQDNPVVWPASNTTPNPNIPGSAPGQPEILTLQDAQGVWANIPSPNGVFGAGSESFSPKMPTSYSEQWNLAVQRVFGQNWIVTLDYLGTADHHTLLVAFPNQAVLPGPNDQNPSSTANINSRRPYQGLPGELTQYTKWGSSNYNALEAQVKKRLSSGLELTTNFTWGKSMDFQSSDRGPKNTSYIMTGRHPQVDYGRSDFDQAYVYKASAIYDLPLGPGRALLSGGNWWDRQLGGWRLSGIFAVNGGFPFDITGKDLSYTGGSGYKRADQVCNDNEVANRSFDQFFNTACYTNPAEGTFGNERRNSLVGPRNTHLDLSVFKEFPIHDRMTFQFRMDAFSALNHPLPEQPNKNGRNLDSNLFGEISSWGGARNLQFGGRLSW